MRTLYSERWDCKHTIYAFSDVKYNTCEGKTGWIINY